MKNLKLKTDFISEEDYWVDCPPDYSPIVMLQGEDGKSGGCLALSSPASDVSTTSLPSFHSHESRRASFRGSLSRGSEAKTSSSSEKQQGQSFQTFLKLFAACVLATCLSYSIFPISRAFMPLVGMNGRYHSRAFSEFELMDSDNGWFHGRLGRISSEITPLGYESEFRDVSSLSWKEVPELEEEDHDRFEFEIEIEGHNFKRKFNDRETSSRASSKTKKVPSEAYNKDKKTRMPLPLRKPVTGSTSPYNRLPEVELS